MILSRIPATGAKLRCTYCSHMIKYVPCFAWEGPPHRYICEHWVGWAVVAVENSMTRRRSITTTIAGFLAASNGLWTPPNSLGTTT